MTTDAGWQPLLWPTAPIGEQFASWSSATRRVLGWGAWVDVVPSWLTGADDLFHALRRDVPWQADERQMYDSMVAVPRLTAWFSDAARVGQPLIPRCRDQLNEHYGHTNDPLVSAGLCLYRDGSDSVAWHGDRIGRGRSEDTLVAVLSLGSARQFLLRPRDGGTALRFTVGHGDLLVMGGSCQRTWDHAVPKTRRHVGPRISVQFRPRGVA